MQRQVDELRGPAGFEAVHGPAITVVLKDAPKDEINRAVEKGEVTADKLVVHQQDIQAVVNALWSGGAEAMTVQKQRVISTTGIKCVGNTVVLHGVPYAPPYEITAIGDLDALQTALDSSDYIAGYRTYVDTYHLGYEVSTRGRRDHAGVQREQRRCATRPLRHPRPSTATSAVYPVCGRGVEGEGEVDGAGDAEGAT